MADLIKYEDSLRQGTDKLNEGLKASNRAEQKSDEALDKANQSLTQSESTQTQLDTIVIEGDSSVEAAQARVDSEGNTFSTLKERLDSKETEFTSQLAQRVNLGDLFGLREERRRGRVEISAETLVTLDIGDDPNKDNTVALQQLADRATRHKEIIVFPSGVIYTNQILLKSNLYWLGKDTVVKLRPQSNKQHYPLIKIENNQDNGTLDTIIFDANKDAHTNVTGDSEGIDFKYVKNWLLWRIDVKNTTADGFDHDGSSNITHVFCTTSDTNLDGFHNSWSSRGNEYYFCQAIRSNGVRGGFTAIEGSFGGHLFYNCVSSDSNRGFQIRPGIDGVINNEVVNCISMNNKLDDEIGGISAGTAPSFYKKQGVPTTYVDDLNNFPEITGVFSIGGSAPNQPSLGTATSGGMLIQTITTSGMIRQIFVKGSDEKVVFYREKRPATGWIDWSILSLANTTLTADLNSVLKLSGVVYMATGSPNNPADSSGTLITSTHRDENSTGGQMFISNGADEFYIRRGNKSPWNRFVMSKRTWSIDLNNPPTDVNPSIFYCGGSALNRPVAKSGTLIYSVSGTGSIAGMQYITNDGEMYIRGTNSGGWKKVVTE